MHFYFVTHDSLSLVSMLVAIAYLVSNEWNKKKMLESKAKKYSKVILKPVMFESKKHEVTSQKCPDFSVGLWRFNWIFTL